MTIVLKEHQVDVVYRAGLSQSPNKLIVLPTGAGKCMGVDTPILMHDGKIKKVQNVNSGDLLMGPDSEPRIVLSTTTGTEMLYRVTPVKGEPYIVNESHILSLKQTGLKSKPKYESQKGKGDVVNISVKDYVNSSNTFKHTHKGWRTGVDYNRKNHSDLLPAYLLGLWLGDGNSDKTTITSADNEIEEFLNCYRVKQGMTMRKESQPNNKSFNYHITDKNTKGKFNRLTDVMRGLNLIRNKHIPHDYLTGDRVQRLELLAGIIDSDGYYDGKTLDVVFKVKQLADDLNYLCRSLGLAAYTKTCQKTCTNTGVKGIYYRTCISGDITEVPCLRGRHKFKSRKQKKSVLVTGIKVEPIGVGDYYGFEITGDRLFMLGDFTVTHNTIVMTELARQERDKSGMCIIFAHRDVLLGQISNALCLMNIRHTFITSKSTITDITNQHVKKYGRSFYDETASIIVSSVATYIRRDTSRLDKLITLWMQDESHHLTKGSIWHRCIENMSNARGIGVTATPIRGDKKGLGRDNDGVYDEIIVGATMGELIEKGMLSAYKIFVPPSKLDTSGMRFTAGGDYNQKELAKRTDNSDITGDAVQHYKRLANDKQGIVFCVNIAHSEHVAKEFRDAGINAVSLSSKDKMSFRNETIRKFKAGQVKVLCNSDLFGEGFDVPAIEVVIMLRKTESYGLFKQIFGRGLRKLEGKEYGILIDHVGNVARHCQHGAPHDDPEWTLDRQEKRSMTEPDENPARICPECFNYYTPSSAGKFVCPDCEHQETPTEEIDAAKKFQAEAGTLVEMNIDFISNLMKERNKVDLPPDVLRQRMQNASPMVRNSALANHQKRQNAQTVLRQKIQDWCEEYHRKNTADIEMVQREFELRFGINILKAQVLGERQANELNQRIK